MPNEYEIIVKNPVSGTSAALIADGTIDLIDSFEHNIATKFTDVPLEDGSIVVDHAIDTPIRIRLNITVSNQHTQSVAAQGGFDLSQMIATGSAGSSPQDVIDSANDLLSKRERKLLENSLAYDDGSQGFAELNKQISDAVIESLRGQIGKTSPSDEIPKGRPRATLEDLLKLKRTRSLLKVSSLLTTYDDMVIEKISFRENVRTGTALEASVDMRQIKFATPVLAIVQTRATKLESMTPDEQIIALNNAFPESEAWAVAEKKPPLWSHVRDFEQKINSRVGYARKFFDFITRH